MLRGHFKTLAIHSLITALLVSPVTAATPGAASRHAASTGRSTIQSNGGQTPSGTVRQVAGTSDYSQTPGLLSGLFGGSSTSRSTANTRSTPRASHTHRGSQSGSGSSSTPSNSRGILGEIFGGRSSQPAAQAPAQTAAQPQKEPRVVDWEGVPYHKAHSQPQTQTQAPIRDPNPNETRITSSRRVSTPAPLPRVAQTPTEVSPNLPKPPQLNPAPTSSRRSTAATVVSTRGNRVTQSVLSPLSSSRRSGRRDLPTLDASEIAAAQPASVSKEDLIPKVARRVIKPEDDAAAQAEPKVAKTQPAKPAGSDQPESASPSDAAPEKLAAAPAAPVAPSQPAEPEASKETPSAEVAVRPNTKPQAEAMAKAQPSKTPAQPADQPDTATAPAEPTAPVHSSQLAANPAAAPSVAQPTAPQAVAPAAPAAAPPAAASQPAAIASNPTGGPFQSRPAGPSTIAAPTAAPQLPPGTTAMQAPQFVSPNLPAPTAPSFGPQGHAVGHRVGPPTSAFQPRGVHQPSVASVDTPIGSGVHSTPTGPAYATPAAQAPSVASAPRVAQNAYPARDPYAYPAQPYGAMPVAPSIPVAPSVARAQPGLGSPTPGLSGIAPALPAHPHPAAATPSPAASPSPMASPSSVASRSPAANRSPVDANRVAEGSVPRNSIRESHPQAPARGETAVASELPGIRVVTHGPSSVIIRQNHEFEIRVENRGSIDAEGVMVRTALPDWANLLGHSPSGGSVENQSADKGKHLVWTIDSLPAGSTERMVVRLKALRSGTHDLDVDWTTLPQRSVASVQVREPKLDLVIEGPEEVVYGESQTYRVRVLNPGDGIAPNITFTLSPESPTPQTQRIGNIPSGKEAQFEIELTAQDLGDLKIHGLASGDLGLKAQAEKNIRVASADLEAILAGPEVRYQNSEAIYHLKLVNNGTATCKDLQANLGLPPGVRYQGGIDSASQRGTQLQWSIPSLPPGSEREYEFTCMMASPGLQTFAFSASGSAAGKTQVALDTRVESIADLVMTIQDPAAPAPVGSEVIYEILIKNRGSRQANGVRAIAQFSNGIEPRRIEGHTGKVLTGQVLLDPIDSIRPGQEIRIRVIAEAETEGHHRFRTEIRSGETVLVAEEATQYLARREHRVSRRSSSSEQR